MPLFTTALGLYGGAVLCAVCCMHNSMQRRAPEARGPRAEGSLSNAINTLYLIWCVAALYWHWSRCPCRL